MRPKLVAIVAATFVGGVLVGAGVVATRVAAQAPAYGQCGRASAPQLRTTLYFGTARPKGSVTELEWQLFLRDEVTRRFHASAGAAVAHYRRRRSIASARRLLLVSRHQRRPVRSGVDREVRFRHSRCSGKPLASAWRPDMDSDEQAIRTLITTWMETTKSGNLDRILELMDDDVVFLGAGRPPMRGKASFAEASRALERSGRFEGTVVVEEVRVFGDWAYCWNQIKVSMTPEAGAPTRLAGSAMAILRRKPDGRWVIFRDANMLAPAP